MTKNYIFLLSLLNLTHLNGSEKQISLKKDAAQKAVLQQIEYSLCRLTNKSFVHRDSPQAIARKIERLQNKKNDILENVEDTSVKKLKRSFEDISL